MNNNQSGLAYGIIREFEDGTTLWYEPITDEIDGFVLRGNEGYVQTVYSEKREAYIMDYKDENIIDVFPKRNKMERKGYCGSVSDKRKMRVDFTFDIAAIEQGGYTLGDIYSTIKKHFAGHNIPCVSDDDILAFEDTGGKDDFSNMWTVIMGLTRQDWFMDFATSCVWHEGTHKREDVLRQARERRKI